MAIIEKAIVGTGGAEMMVLLSVRGEARYELAGSNDSEVWVTDSGGRPLSFAFAPGGVLREGDRVNITTVTGDVLGGVFAGTSEFGLVLRTDGTTAAAVPQKKISSLELPDAFPLPVVRFDNPGKAFVRYRTETVHADIRTLIHLTTDRLSPGAVAESSSSLTAGTSVEVENSSGKPQKIKMASVVPHAISSPAFEKQYHGEMRASAAAAPARRAADVGNSRDDTFTATLRNLNLQPHSTSSVALPPWTFGHSVVSTLRLYYGAGKIMLSAAYSTLLVTSEDERLFPGGSTAVVVNEAEISDNTTQQLAFGESMAIALFPNQRVSAKAEKVRVSAPPARIALSRQPVRTASEGSGGELEEKFEFVDFDVAITVRQAKPGELILLATAEEVVETTIRETLTTNDGTTHHVFEVPESGDRVVRGHFRLRVAAH